MKKLACALSAVTALSIGIAGLPAADAGGIVHHARGGAVVARGDDNIKVRDKWALLIGVDKFQDPSVKPNKEAAKNVETLAALLNSPTAGRFHPGHVKVLTGRNATASGITTAINEWLVKKALPDDLIFLYVSSVANKGGDGQPVAFSYDTLGSESELSGIDLSAFLDEVRKRTRCRFILCALDTSPAPRTDGINVKDLEKTGVTVLSATNGHEQSLNNGVTGSSVFVHHLGEALSLEGGQLTVEQVFDHLRKYITDDAEKAFHTKQTPTFVLGAEPQIIQVALGAPPRVPAVAGSSMNIGHPVNKLAFEHPGLIAPHDVPGGQRIEKTNGGAQKPATPPPAASSKAAAPQNDADDDDDDDGDKPGQRRQVDFGSYMSKMKQDIQKHWTPPKGLENRRIVSVFSIMRDGRIIDAHIVEGSGVPEVDQSALDALKAASPLDPLPPGSPASVDIKYKFDWQVKAR